MEFTKELYLKSIPRSLAGLKREISKNLSHEITNIPFDWNEHWRVHEIGLEEKYLFMFEIPLKLFLKC